MRRLFGGLLALLLLAPALVARDDQKKDPP